MVYRIHQDALGLSDDVAGSHRVAQLSNFLGVGERDGGLFQRAIVTHHPDHLTNPQINDDDD